MPTPNLQAKGASKKKILYALIAIVAIAISAVFYYGVFFASNPQDIPSALVGKPAANFYSAELFEGADFSLADFKGQRVLLNFWASWCIACRAEAAVFSKIHSNHPEIKVIGLAVSDNLDAAQAFALQYHKKYLLGLASPSTVLDYGITGVPETLLIGADGLIIHKFIGEVNLQDLEIELAKLQ